MDFNSYAARTGYQSSKHGLAHDRPFHGLMCPSESGEFQGISSEYKHRALFAYVRSLIPEEATVLVAGDSEIGGVSVLQLLNQ